MALVKKRPDRRGRGVLGAGSVARGSAQTSRRGADNPLAKLAVKNRLSAREVGVLMVAGGFLKNSTVIAHGMAIVHCESSGRRKATSHNPSGGTNRSIWQIDDGSHPITKDCALNNLCATKMAAEISGGGTNFGPWACKNASIEPYWDLAREISEADSSSLFGGIGNPLKSAGDLFGGVADAITSPFSSVADAVGAIVKFIARLFEPSFWVRVGKGVLGLILLIFGMIVLLKALLGVDLGPYAEGIVGTIGGQRVRALRGGVNPSRSRLSSQEAAGRSYAQQAARERAKSEGESARRQRFFDERKEPPF